MWNYVTRCWNAEMMVWLPLPPFSRMELRTEPVVAALDMSESKEIRDGKSLEGDDYESLPPTASLVTHMTAGAVAGILEHTVMFPVDSVKALIAGPFGTVHLSPTGFRAALYVARQHTVTKNQSGLLVEHKLKESIWHYTVRSITKGGSQSLPLTCSGAENQSPTAEGQACSPCSYELISKLSVTQPRLLADTRLAPRSPSAPADSRGQCTMSFSGHEHTKAPVLVNTATGHNHTAELSYWEKQSRASKHVNEAIQQSWLWSFESVTSQAPPELPRAASSPPDSNIKMLWPVVSPAESDSVYLSLKFWERVRFVEGFRRSNNSNRYSPSYCSSVPFESALVPECVNSSPQFVVFSPQSSLLVKCCGISLTSTVLWCDPCRSLDGGTRMQSLQPDPKAQYRSVFEALSRIIKTEGLLRPLRGLNITMLGAGPAHALYFACYERVKRGLSDVIQNGGNSHIANAGSLATVLHDAVMNPAEVVKQRMQMYNSPYRGLLDCIRTVQAKEGIAAFYRSYSTQLTMNIPFQAVHFITYELMQEQLNPHRQYHPASHILSGAAAGAVSAAVTTPMDVCKTLLNTQENVALSSVHISGHLSGMANAFRTVYRLGGLPAFFKGVQARVIYQMPSTAISWSVYEFFKYFLTKHQLAREEDRAGPT
ncbi:hypothetical protein JZ751_001461 [Albula glossodonta]|uniref:Mitoferrin-1 n=1 Tax=Albula glossodonta TaxID=121402 RepID=A0A8T2PU10_9TELE|nr:hypothetical protein JZ751_001461 [Albula glossodonta]